MYVCPMQFTEVKLAGSTLRLNSVELFRTNYFGAKPLRRLGQVLKHSSLETSFSTPFGKSVVTRCCRRRLTLSPESRGPSRQLITDAGPLGSTHSAGVTGGGGGQLGSHDWRPS